jgi:hypothetical protein
LIPLLQVKILFNSSLFIRIDELSAMATLRGGVWRRHANTGASNVACGDCQAGMSCFSLS